MPLMLRRAAAALLLLPHAAHAQEPRSAHVPTAVAALKGCWEGSGEVMEKPVRITLAAQAIVQQAMFAVDVESAATADKGDAYSAHLIFGGADAQPSASAEAVTGFWADSFGGAFTAVGRGEAQADGFDITYPYPDAAFVNRWRRTGDRLTWQIAARDEKGVEKPFARYTLARVKCPRSVR